jgi:hypothetical protein
MGLDISLFNLSLDLLEDIAVVYLYWCHW